MAMLPSLSVVVPAYNEAGNLEATIAGIVGGIGPQFSAYEIIIVNDRSKDTTGEFAEKLAARHQQIRVIHHPINKGFGGSYQTGVHAAQYDYIAMIPADNEIVHESIRNIFSLAGQVDIVIPYGAKENVRPWIRSKLSRLWTFLLNNLFGYHLKYYNGPSVYKKTILKEIPIKTNSFGFMASNLIRALDRGSSYQEVPFRLQPRLYGKTQAFRLKNVLRTFMSIVQLFLELRVRRKKNKKETGPTT